VTQEIARLQSLVDALRGPFNLRCEYNRDGHCWVHDWHEGPLCPHDVARRVLPDDIAPMDWAKWIEEVEGCTF
jgi:hypothetical protein